jgi:hypothetical protein
LANPKTTYHFAPPRQEPHRKGGGEQKASPALFRPARVPANSGADPSGTTSPSFDRLVMPTWAEVDQAREQYETQARRLLWWRRWFVGIFTIYTTLAGILMLRLFLGQ